MKIFLSFLQSGHKYPIPAYDFWEHYIKNGINEAGYEWTECPGADWALGLVPQSQNDLLKWKQDIWEKTVAWLKKNPVDLFLSYLYPQQIDETAIKVIQGMGIPCVNFFCDNVREFKNIPAEFRAFDLNWVPEYKAVKMYKKAGYAHINLPMPMWVEPKYRVLKEEKHDQITFIGSKDIQRKLLFEKLLELEPGLNLAIYGNAWVAENAPGDQPVMPGYTFSKKILFNLNFISNEGVAAFVRKLKYRNIRQDLSSLLGTKTQSSISFEEYNSLTSESMITLGVNRFPSFRFPLSRPGTYSRLRDIEAPMLGACYLTEWTEGIEELYDIENEIAVYKNAEDLALKIKELQANPHKRKTLKINGRKRALNEHQIGNSLNKILQRILH
ncbi:MAG: glycosyltransferase [Sphingobacteriales bacterium]